LHSVLHFYIEYVSWDNYSYIKVITNNCTKSDYFEIDDNGDISIVKTPSEGNYSVNIFAVDRFGLKALENQNIEVVKP